MTNQRVSILGVAINAVSINEAIAAIIERANKPRAKAVYVVKPYVEFIDRAAQDDAYRQILNNAFLSLPDGIAIKWAAYFNQTNGGLINLAKSLLMIVKRDPRLNQVVPEHFGGINFTGPLLEAAAQKSLSVYLVGSPYNRSITETGRYLERKYPGLKVVGTLEGRSSSGRFNNLLESKLVDDLRRLKPALVLIGLSSGLQEEVMARVVAKIPRGVLIGEGGSFDYQAFGGIRRRAPLWMQRSGLEWLWRLLLEPKRVVRQLAIPRFIWNVYRKNTIAK